MLFICTGNTCRSPMAEALWNAAADERGVGLLASSAGTLGWTGRPATDHAQSVLAERNIAIDHASRRIDAAMVAEATVIVAMTREHAYGVHAFDHGAADRTFLLPELVRLSLGVDFDAQSSTATWVAELTGRRGSARIPGRAADEIADPAGESRERYEATAATIERHIAALIEMLAG